MNLDKINLNHLRVFESVFRTKSMTLAAKELHLTQSGVSQHMKALEDSLGFTLFDRIKQRLIPSESAEKLYKACLDGLQTIEGAITEMKGGKQEVSGFFRFGMPLEFGNNLVLPLVSKWTKLHPKLSFQIYYGLASEMLEYLVSGELDFAFLDSFVSDSRIKTTKVYDEVLDLYVHQELLPKDWSKNPYDSLKKLHYVDYQEGEPIIRMWFQHHFKKEPEVLSTQAMLSDVKGVSSLVMDAVGGGVIPRHRMLQYDLDQVKLEKIEVSKTPLTNTIGLATLQKRNLSHATKVTIDYLTSELSKVQKSNELKS